MSYRNNIELIANNRDVLTQGDVAVKEMCQLAITILNFRYSMKNEDLTKGTVMKDMINKIKNDMAIAIGDLEIYAQQLEITDDLINGKSKRIAKIASKL